MSAAAGTTEAARDLLPILAVTLPVIGLIVLQVVPSRLTRTVTIATVLGGLAAVAGLLRQVWGLGTVAQVVAGGWNPPLGIALRADGTSALLLAVSAVVVSAALAFALLDDDGPADPAASDRLPLFVSLVLAVWSALNAVAMAQDLFNLYVALELLTFAAVPLVCFNRSRDSLSAALRYLLFALLGSLLYLLGTGLLYGVAGTLDIPGVARVLTPTAPVLVALGLMTAGLLAKAALCPLHLWLPPAHAGAPPAASAILSALVIKAPYFILLRLWLDAAPPALAAGPAAALGALGGFSVLYASLLAVAQVRLKLMIAYSTLAQLGYLFLVFPLAFGAGAATAWTAGALQLASHALAKAGMFLAAGVVANAYGHDRIADLRGFARALPVGALAFAIAGCSLVGLPPTGGFNAKWLLLSAAISGGHAWLVAVILGGGLLAAGYVFRVVGVALASLPGDAGLADASRQGRQWVALVLALGAVALGLLPVEPAAWLQIGRSVAGGGP